MRLIRSFFLFLAVKIFKGGKDMALVWVTLMTKNPKIYKYADTPPVIKEEVDVMLSNLGLSELIEG